MFNPHQSFCTGDDGKFFGAIRVADAAAFKMLQLTVDVDEGLGGLDHILNVETSDGGV